MNAETPSTPPETTGNKLRVKIIGVGTAGTIMVDQLNREEFAAASFAFVNTDATAPSGPTKHLLLETAPVRGLGTGGDPERGRRLAEENFSALKFICAEADVIFLVSGLGGGAGSGVMPVIARAARETGALVMAFVTLPFDCEGNRRQQQARLALEDLQEASDGVLCLPNQKAISLLAANCSFSDAFRTTTRLLTEGLRGIWRLLMYRGLLEIPFADLRAVLRERQRECAFATLEASGLDRARDILAALPLHPLLEGGRALEEAATVLVSLCGGANLTMAEVNQVMQDVNGRCARARVIVGAAQDEQFGDRLALTIIAAKPGRDEQLKGEESVSRAETEPATAPEFSSEFLHPTEIERPKTRVVPPSPTLTATQREELITKQAGKVVRTRKNSGPRMRQTTLPLDIVTKGRFDKSEPTIHKGEDLDLPTYIRRGIALN